MLFVVSADKTAQASHLHYKFVSSWPLPAIQNHKRNILCKERLKSAWRREAESVTICSRQLFVANRTEMEESYRNHLTKVRHAFFPLTCTRYQRYLTNLRQRLNQGPLSELERTWLCLARMWWLFPSWLQARAWRKKPIFSIRDGQAQKSSLKGKTSPLTIKHS